MNLLDAFFNTVHDYPGGAESLAPRMGMSAAILRNKADQTKEHNKPLLVDADKAMGLTGDYRILDALARNHGFVLHRKEDGVIASDMSVVEVVGMIWKAEGEVGAQVSQTLADGKVEKSEVEKVKEAVYRLEQMLGTLTKRLEGMAEK
ncbi:phage regulatory CII family protein [Herbaspirillum sp. GCM10030257]|uniref:phage regulatory CII family protein n=1 Tax=Herbaspirillum sp. GCM10030257 TaxID=3273393 RepID=UPI00360E01E6